MEHTQEPPTTIKEVGIHIGYMREDIHELKKLIESMPSGLATKEELNALASRVTDIENDRKWLVRTVVGSVILALLALVGIGANTFGK